MSSCRVFQLWGEVDNIDVNHIHIGKHDWKWVGGAVCQCLDFVGASCCMVPTFTWFIFVLIYLRNDFFLGWTYKNIVYQTPAASDIEILARIISTAANICKFPGMFQNVQQFMWHRCRALQVVWSSNLSSKTLFCVY